MYARIPPAESILAGLKNEAMAIFQRGKYTLGFGRTKEKVYFWVAMA